MGLQVKCWYAEIVGRVCVGVMGISVSLIKECKFSAASLNIWMRKRNPVKWESQKVSLLAVARASGVWEYGFSL